MRSGKREELDPDGGHREGARDCQALSPWFAWEAHAERPRSGVPTCLLYTSPSPRDKRQSRMPSSA